MKRRLRLLRNVCLASLCGMTWSARAHADPLLLEWVAPVACPSREDVVHQVQRILGPDRVASHPPVHARAGLFRGEDALWHVTITAPSTRQGRAQGGS